MSKRLIIHFFQFHFKINFYFYRPNLSSNGFVEQNNSRPIKQPVLVAHLDFQFLGRVIAQQVPDLLVVDLDVADPHVEHRVVVLLCLLPLEYVDYCSGN